MFSAGNHARGAEVAGRERGGAREDGVEDIHTGATNQPNASANQSKAFDLSVSWTQVQDLVSDSTTLPSVQSMLQTPEWCEWARHHCRVAPPRIHFTPACEETRRVYL
jgi:hypothetical protein